MLGGLGAPCATEQRLSVASPSSRSAHFRQRAVLHIMGDDAVAKVHQLCEELSDVCRVDCFHPKTKQEFEQVHCEKTVFRAMRLKANVPVLAFENNFVKVSEISLPC